MKVKTSITLSAELIRQIDALASQYGTRSALIERAVRDFLAAQAKRTREAQDLEILNRRAEALDAEAEDVLSYQVELWDAASWLYLSKGDLDKAIPKLERSLEPHQLWDLPLQFPWIASQLGYAYALSGRIVEALPLLERAVEQGSSLIGTLYAKLSRRESSRAELSVAINLYRAMEMTFWLTRAEAVLTQAK
jgi:tetratricopeptide (TPR) repeat protein